jgi:hypothetical protein
LWDHWLYWKHWDAGLAIHHTRPPLRRMFGSAGVLTRLTGCSETRPGRVLGYHQLSQGSSTHSLARARVAVRQGGYDLEGLGDGVVESFRALIGDASADSFDAKTLIEEPHDKLREAIRLAKATHSL